MNKIDYNIWTKLEGFSLDVPEASFSFSDRLARENGWSKNYTVRVITEYKKFVFLSVISGKSLTPSDEVDQAWHMHMLYTRSYWEDMCKNLLGGFMLHHGPTKGGRTESSRFNNQYEETLKLYKEVFNESAPSDIWPSSEKRFSPMDYKRINVNEFFVFNKEEYRRKLISCMIPIVGFVLIWTLTFSTNPNDSSETFKPLISILFLVMLIWFFVNLFSSETKSSKDTHNYNSKRSVKNKTESKSKPTTKNESTSSSSYPVGCTAGGCGTSSSSGCGSSGCGGCGGCGGGCGG